jgi:flagellar biosynthesis protein FliP
MKKIFVYTNIVMAVALLITTSIMACYYNEKNKQVIQEQNKEIIKLKNKLEWKEK